MITLVLELSLPWPEIAASSGQCGTCVRTPERSEQTNPTAIFVVNRASDVA